MKLGWLDYGARFYDPAIGRFTGVDPISDQFPHLSTYNYASNDPIGNIDLHGLQGISAISGKILNYIISGKSSSSSSAKSVRDYYNPGSLLSGSTSEKYQTISKVQYTDNLANDLSTNSLLLTRDISRDVQTGSAYVEVGALMLAPETGGATLPIAAGAEVVGDIAFAVELMVNLSLGESSGEIAKDVAVWALFKGLGKSADDVIESGAGDILKRDGNIDLKKTEKQKERAKSVTNSGLTITEENIE